MTLPSHRASSRRVRVKPPALAPGGTLRIISPASPADPKKIARGVAELERLGYAVSQPRHPAKSLNYFAGPAAARAAEFAAALRSRDADAVLCARGGYGCATLLPHLHLPRRLPPKLLIGYSDITVLHAYLWRHYRWPSLYGPMAAAGFDFGPARRDGYDLSSFLHAVRGTSHWSMELGGETLVPGEATGVLLGGCVTLLQCMIATNWELDTRGAILLLEDCGIRPYQLDRMLVHLAQARKFRGVRGIVLGEFPAAGPRRRGEATARDVCRRILEPLGIPIVFGAAVGHTPRPMLTLPLGVRVRLHARGAGKLEILEPVTQMAR